MSGGAIIAIVVIAVIIIGVAGAAALYSVRQRRLRERFGPEYDRLAEEYHSRRKAEAELAGRQRRVRELDIQPLDPTARARYRDQWAAVQEFFIDSPQRAVADAQRLVMTVMNERGYLTEQDDQILADLSVDHAYVLDHYRAASAISESAAAGTASTEDSRQALIHYRALFRELLDEPHETAPDVEASGAEPVSAAPQARPAPAAADETTSIPRQTLPAPEEMTLAEPEESTPAEAEETAPAEADEPTTAEEQEPTPAETQNGARWPTSRLRE